MRLLTDIEKIVIAQMIESLPEQQREIMLSDLQNSVVKPINYDGSIIEFEIGGYRRPNSPGRSKLVEGRVNDADGAKLDVILFGDSNARLYEFEIVRYDVGEILGPNWTTLELY